MYMRDKFWLIKFRCVTHLEQGWSKFALPINSYKTDRLLYLYFCYISIFIAFLRWEIT